MQPEIKAFASDFMNTYVRRIDRYGAIQIHVYGGLAGLQ